jgi:hypothetical protein
MGCRIREVDDVSRDQMITRVLERSLGCHKASVPIEPTAQSCYYARSRRGNQNPGGAISAVSGRKPKQESRSVEFRQRLIQWKQTPVAFRPSLRTLARELGTSLQLLTFYLKRLEKWQGKECLRQAREIRVRANAEGRPMTQWEEQRVVVYTRAGIRALATSALRDKLEDLRRDAKRGPLHWAQIKMLKLFARAFPEAQKLLQKLQSSVKNQKDNLPVISPCAAKSFRCEQR